MSNFIDDDGQCEDKWNILALFDFHTVLIADGEELLRDGSDQVVSVLDFEFSRTEIAFDFEFAEFRFNFEFLATN